MANGKSYQNHVPDLVDSDEGGPGGEVSSLRERIFRLEKENNLLRQRLRQEREERIKAIDVFQENEQDLLENFTTAIDFLGDVKKALLMPEGASHQVMGCHGTMEDDLLFIREVAQGLGPPGAAEKLDVKQSLEQLIRQFNAWKTHFKQELTNAYKELVEQKGGG